MDLGLSNDRALVTGSSRGIGLAIATEFLREGASVILTGRAADTLQAAELALRDEFGSAKVASYAGDLGKRAVLDSLHECATTLGGVDHLVCNVGSGVSVPPLEEDRAEVERMLEVNLMVGVDVVDRFKSDLLAAAQDGSAEPTIVFVGSICGVEVLGCPIGYAVAKAAVATYSASLAHAMGAGGIRVNTVSPGNVLFEGSTWQRRLERQPEVVGRMLDRDVALGRLGTSAEIAAVVVFLASRRARFVTGANWIVDGGQVRRV